MPPSYFIGLTLPTDISSAIIDVQTSLYDDNILLQPLVPHITIIQPNALSQISPIWIKPVAKNIANNYLPLKAKITDVKTFNDKVIYLAIDCPGLIDMQKDLVAALPKDIYQRYYVGRLPYTPHITIAQTKNQTALSSAIIASYTEALQNFVNQDLNINIIYIFKHSAPRTYKIQKI